jgi:PAS domain S-box-containing protein
VVEDDPINASFVADLLDDAGYQPIVCHSGMEALAKAREQPVDLVVLDVVMPGMDGLTTAHELKKLFGADCFVPIILLSALAAEETKIAGLSCADDYVVKPFSRVELMARIRAFLRIQAMHREMAFSRRLYQTLYDSAPYMSISLDQSHVVTGCNSAFAQAAGLSSEAIKGQRFASFFAADEQFALAHFLSALSRESGAEREAKFTMHPRGPGAEPVAVGARAVQVGPSEPALAIVVVMQDITRKIRMEEEQKMARLQLYRSARLTSLGTLASGVAHEMNNPLTAILGFSSALLDRVRKEGSAPREELEEYLTIINNESLRCRDIVETLSGFARDREARVTDVSLAESVNAAVRLLLPRAQKQRVTISTSVPEGLGVRADGGRLGQALVNIISNSLDFMTGAGSVVIAAESQSSHSGFVAVRITDDGPGIAPEILPKVFDPFFSTREVGKGMGLGLTMCHTIMKEFGGAIDIASELGKGTTVVLEIPQAGAQ